DLVEALTWLKRPPRRRRRGELSFSSAPIPCRTRLWSEDHSLPSLSSAASRPLLIWSSNFPPVTLLAASAALSRPWSLICSPLSLFMASLALLVRSSTPILAPFIGRGSKRTFWRFHPATYSVVATPRCPVSQRMHIKLRSTSTGTGLLDNGRQRRHGITGTAG